MKSFFVRLLAGIGLAVVFVVAARLTGIDPYIAMAFFAGGMAGGLVELAWRWE